MLGTISTISKRSVANQFDKIRFLIGDFHVTAFNSDASKGWFQSGQGKASFILEDTFITEKVEIIRENESFVMNNTLGCDQEKDSYNMQTLNISSGNMDIFRGAIQNGVLLLTNESSELKMKNDNGDLLQFKLIYKQLSLSENELIIGCSKDNGDTWIPLLKNLYKRK